jgi:ribosome-associated protein
MASIPVPGLTAPMIELGPRVSVPDEELQFSAIRAQGSGGQNVNKVSNAIHLRFDVGASSLPQELKDALLALRDQRISAAGVIVIKAQRFRSLEKNRDDALERLRALVARALDRPAPRVATRPSRAARRRRVDDKSRRGVVKTLRRVVPTE